MHRVVCLILIATLTLVSAGCLTQSPSPAEDADIRLLTPDEGFSIFDGQGHYSGIIGEETPDITINYSMGCVTLPPGNGTLPHRLLGTSEMVCVIGGEAEIHCDATTVTAREGEIVVLPMGVLQTITAAGDVPLRYIDVIQPPFSAGVELSGDELAAYAPGTDGGATNGIPIVIPDPREGIEWDIGSDMMIYTLANPVLMPDKHFPVDYSVAYAEILPGGSADFNELAGASEVIYVITGEVEVFTPGGTMIQVPAGNVAYIAPDQEKGYRNAGEVNATMLSFVDPAWTPERTIPVE
ncbi:cupin domain-containing protein [Methanogenium organophilum]|uniref:Cupin domain-containing protein n=1 Tax=Methanogenium organophilum TaxID=2199 RepID=A0A9X9T8T6_METOG|nr:cupin domain-containing protein [Methanogenium organophilum]WAI01766.1 cupin domain-containing protein [Methanogenium organophilum]